MTGCAGRECDVARDLDLGQGNQSGLGKIACMLVLNRRLKEITIHDV